MNVQLRVSGGRVYLPSGPVDADLLVNDEKIVGLVGRDTEVADIGTVLDATGKVVLPGMVDVHVHTREPGFTRKEDIYTTTLQAAAGGVTTIFGMPNLEPPTNSAERLRDVFDLYEQKSIVDYNHNPAATVPDELRPMAEMGINAFKVYMVVDTGRTYPHPAGTGMHAHGDLLKAMDIIATTGKRFIIHPHDQSLMDYIEGEYLVIHPHDQSLMDYIEGEYLARGENTPQGYASAYAARGGVIWDTAVDVVLRLAEASGCPVHLAHMQTKRSIEAVRRAKARGVDVTCEVNHWLPFLSTWADVERLGPYALSYWVPDEGREAVWDGLRDGTIDLFSSDHAPHLREEKEIGWQKMWSAHTGTPGIQYFYPLALDAVNKGQLTLEQVVKLMAWTPAQKFGLAGKKGALTPGHDADFVIAEMSTSWTIRNEDVLSRCGWTCYDGRKLSASIEASYVRGTPVFTGGQVVGKAGHGKLATKEQVSTR